MKLSLINSLTSSINHHTSSIIHLTSSIIYHTSLILLLLLVLGFLSCSKSEQDVKAKEYWTCTMHPQVKSDKPGACPICNMDLVKRAEDSSLNESINEGTSGVILLSSKKQVLANISTVKVKKEKLFNQLTAYSNLELAENNRKTISARFNGRIEKLYVDKTGDYISKGQPLFEIYSPELVQAQNDFLISMKNFDNAALLKSSKKKLKIFGLTESQIQKLEETKEINFTLTYHSPFSGTVIEKKVQEGDYILEGTKIYEIADLTILWNIAEVYEDDLNKIKIGSAVKLYLKSYPGEVFNGNVTFIYPTVNAQSRTVKVRSEFPNYRGKLKPQMYGETIFSHDNGYGLVVPVDAVIIAGKRVV
ncbi:MAG: efflux RND transporter periplasmic adaptor subunit, partial [Ignavibacteria bacterium]|nr:efflux RND transporter periplasmic adaptor subunit [Ignavibacteria bacterium]